MKKLLSVLLIVALVSCEDPDPHPIVNVNSGWAQDTRLYVIDGCEYVGVLNGTNSDVLAHKGNCKNPIHWYKGDTLFPINLKQ